MMMLREDDVEEENRSQDREAHFVRAAAQAQTFVRLRSQNACQHFTRATFYGNLQVKCARPE